jgi:hypothetical protein
MNRNYLPKKWKIHLFTTLLFLLFSSNVFAQATNATIAGLVKDKIKFPLIGATVRIENLST